jgi:hypothetical protein
MREESPIDMLSTRAPDVAGGVGGSSASARLLCPRCGSVNSRRINSRRYNAKRLSDHNVVARPHRCCCCGKEWVSIETPLLGKMAEAVLSVLDG